MIFFLEDKSKKFSKKYKRSGDGHRMNEKKQKNIILKNKHYLYEQSVQNVEFELGIIKRFYRKYYKKKAIFIKEDFCGTMALSCAWVSNNKNHKALAVDLDDKTLSWGRKHNVLQLTKEEQDRLQIIQANVLDLVRPKVEVILALNFSYWVFTKPPELLNYFRKAYNSLEKNGLLILDAFGGPAAEREQEETRNHKGFKYIWEHAYFYPLTREIGCKIHFDFKDGTRIKNAFTYHWRLWTPPEISDLLLKAGFAKVDWYMEGTDEKTGEGDGIFSLAKRGENAETWLAYAIAVK